MSGDRDWWDDATLILMGTGNLHLAEQFAAWCAHVNQQMRDVCGIDDASQETP